MADIISLADRRAAKAAAVPLSTQDNILRLIQQIADNLGIDVEAPFRCKPADLQEGP